MERERNARALNAEPNITPMIDVLLVMLVIFMFAIPQAQRMLEVQVPDPTAKGEGVAIVLEVGPGARLAINRQPVAVSELGIRLRAIYEKRPDKVLLVHGDDHATYESVVAAIDSARGAGVRVVGLDPRR